MPDNSFHANRPGDGLTLNVTLPDGMLYWFNSGVLVKKTNPPPSAIPGAFSVLVTQQTALELALNIDGNGGATAVILEISTDGGASYTEAMQKDTDLSEVDFFVTGLTAGTEYYFRVCYATDGGKGAYSEPQQVYTLATPPTLSGTGGVYITLNWVFGGLFATTKVERSTDGENFVQINSVPAEESTYQDNADAGNYYYRIYNDNGYWITDRSNVVLLNCNA